MRRNFARLSARREVHSVNRFGAAADSGNQHEISQDSLDSLITEALAARGRDNVSAILIDDTGRILSAWLPAAFAGLGGVHASRTSLARV